MPKTYLICISKKFLTEGYQIPIQYNLFENEVEGEAETYIKPNYEESYFGFDQYLCHHDFKHKKKGKVFQKNFSYFFEPADFNLYYNPETSLTLIGIKTDIALDFINELNKTEYYDISTIKINFEKMIPQFVEIGGAWFADLKKAHLNSAALFGSHVNKSEEYKEAAKEGNISSLNIKYISRADANEYTVMITNKGSIVLYDKVETIKEELELVLDIYEHLIKPHENT